MNKANCYEWSALAPLIKAGQEADPWSIFAFPRTMGYFKLITTPPPLPAINPPPPPPPPPHPIHTMLKFTMLKFTIPVGERRGEGLCAHLSESRLVASFSISPGVSYLREASHSCCVPCGVLCYLTATEELQLIISIQWNFTLESL